MLLDDLKRDILHPEVPAALCDQGLPLLTTTHDGVLELVQDVENAANRGG
jgi:hypothetical protein